MVIYVRKYSLIRYDDPSELGEPSGIVINLYELLDELDFVRRYCERKKDERSLRIAKEIRKMLKKIFVLQREFYIAFVTEELHSEYNRSRSAYSLKLDLIDRKKKQRI